MSKPKIYGFPPSSYVRTARMTCVEKGIEHDFEAIEPGGDLHKSLHPYTKVPALKHGDVHLWETQAIAFYIDSKFDGPSLTPSEPAQIGAMHQWISAHNCYIYSDVVPGYLFKYIFAKGEPDREAINQALPNLERDFGLLEQTLDGNQWLAGTFGLADLFLAPVVAPLGAFAETGKLLDQSPNIRKWITALEGRKSAEFLYPPKP